MWEAIRFCAVPTSHACMRPLPPTRFLFSLSRPRDRAPPRRHHGLRSVLSIVPMAAPSATLPAPALENIASCLLSGADSQTGLLALVALAGVDRHWRRTVRRLRAEDNLVFDALEVCNRKTLGRPLLQQEITFAKASPDTKASFFLSAARLFVGYGEVAFVGPGVTDLLLLEVARKLQHGLVAVRMQGCPAVTDSGINTLLLLCPNLERLQLDELPLVRGIFLPALLRHCTHLHALQLTHMPHFKWSCLAPQLKFLPPARRLQSLRTLDIALGQLHAPLVFSCTPNLRWLSLDGSAECVRAAVSACPKLKEVHYISQHQAGGVDEALLALGRCENLKVLELHHQGSMMSAVQLRRAGQLPLNELRLESQAFRKASAVTHATPSHIDDRGVRALVDSICQRWRIDQGPQPFKLSLRGATAITHDAVSSLLRLPMLSELRIDGCPKIQALDKMRLIAKVKAGRELLESEEKRRQSFGSCGTGRNSGSFRMHGLSSAPGSTSSHGWGLP